jgi:acyl-CoA synthetase (AMP-forming)/AMP-acid ligase II/acyl carrier protein
MKTPRLLYHLIIEAGNLTPQAPAIWFPEKEVLTFRELSLHLQSICLQLTRLGMRPGYRLAVVLPNGPEMATTFLAISAVCTCAPLNPAYRVEEFKASMEDLQVKALVTSYGSDHPGQKAAADLGIPIINLEPDGRIAGIFRLACDLPENQAISEATLAGVGDVALVLQTSGTTSRPKTVPLTHTNIIHSVNNIAETYALTRADCCLNMMPLFHIHGLIAAVAASLASGASVVCAPGFLPDQVLGWLTRMGPTWYTAVPTMHQAIMEKVRLQPEVVRQMKLRFIRSCSSSLAPQLAQDLEAAFGVPVLEAYGMTEGTHQIASNPLPPRPRKFGSVGLPTGITRISILDEHGKALPTNTIGEICIRGENVMGGYENNPTANATNFTDGWLRTGDRGSLDEDGYLFIQGRLKELINRGGEKISPREIDEVLLRHPAVKQAVAFAVSHQSLGEDVGAAIVLRDGQTVSVQELRKFAAVSLADFKVPRQIVFVQEIPKGATGKIQRIGLAEKLKDELESFLSQETGGTTAPSTPLEVELLAIWQQVMDKPQIGVQDDFLALGGDSIQAARILTQVNERFGTDLQIIEIFSASTVASMANLVQEIKDGGIHD